MTHVQLAVLVRALDRICETVHPSGENIAVFVGRDIRDLLMLAAVEAEARWRGMLAANGVRADRLTTVDNDRKSKGSASAKSNRDADRKGPARKSERPLFTRAIKVRLPEEDHARLADDAQVAELTIPEIVWRRYFGRRIIAHADMVMVREWRRQGGLLKAA